MAHINLLYQMEANNVNMVLKISTQILWYSQYIKQIIWLLVKH